MQSLLGCDSPELAEIFTSGRGDSCPEVPVSLPACWSGHVHLHGSSLPRVMSTPAGAYRKQHRRSHPIFDKGMHAPLSSSSAFGGYQLQPKVFLRVDSAPQSYHTSELVPAPLSRAPQRTHPPNLPRFSAALHDLLVPPRARHRAGMHRQTWVPGESRQPMSHQLLSFIWWMVTNAGERFLPISKGEGAQQNGFL